MSVITQSGNNIEYIIVDGGSKDGTIDLIRDFAAKDMRVRWISEPDEGIADAFNKGLTMATSDWVGILNSDDCYAPDVLQAVIEAIEAHPEADVIHGNMLRLDDDGRPMFVLRPAPIEKAIWHQMPLNHPTVFVARRAYERVGGFDKKLRIAMDYDLMLRLYRSGARFIYLDRVLAHMRYGGASDARLWQGLHEIYRITVAQGYPRWKAAGWFCWRGGLGLLKNLLRQTGLSRLLLLHPRFRVQD